MSGYIKLQRDIFEWCDDNISKGDRKEYSKREAMIWLMIHTSYNGDLIDYNGEKLDKGESKNSLSFLAEAFGWDYVKNPRDKVKKFLNQLIKTETIERIGGKGDDWKIRFKNWQKYQESGRKSATPSATPSAINTSNNDSSLRSSSYITPGNNNAKNNNNTASLRSADATAAESAFSEKDKGQMPSGPQGLYQPKPVKAPEFPMAQQPLSNNEANAFGIVEVFDRLKLYLPSGFTLDKNQQSFIRTEYFKISNPNRRQGAFRKQNGDLWDLYGFTEWMAKLLREQGVPASEKPSVKPTPQSGNATQLRASDIFSMNGHTGTEGGMDLIRKLGGKIL